MTIYFYFSLGQKQYFYTLFVHNETCLSGILQTSTTYPAIVIVIGAVVAAAVALLMLFQCAFLQINKDKRKKNNNNNNNKRRKMNKRAHKHTKKCV